MEMSVREARAGFAAALSAAERGERVVITKNGRPVAELGPPTAPVRKLKLDWAELDRIQEELGIPKPSVPLDDKWLEAFNSPDWTEELFGPEYR
jgi:prevent-host-death family protein